MPTFLSVGCGCRGHDCFDLWALATKGPTEEAALLHRLRDGGVIPRDGRSQA